MSPLRLPRADDPLPGIHERLAPPETRIEYLHGGELFSAPADPPHATQHCRLSYVLAAHIAPNYTGAVDMLTRTGPATDIAPDASVFPSKPDPHTGRRQLEELAFEVSSEQALNVPTEKARELIRRGVRRVFCILVAKKRVLEWSRRTAGWATVPISGFIKDRCLVRPLPVRALLDASAADGAAAQALLAKRGPEIQQALAEQRARGEARGEARGSAKGRAASIVAVLEARGITLSTKQRRRIQSTTEIATLDGWLRRAVTAATVAELFDEE